MAQAFALPGEGHRQCSMVDDCDIGVRESGRYAGRCDVRFAGYAKFEASQTDDPFCCSCQSFIGVHEYCTHSHLH